MSSYKLCFFVPAEHAEGVKSAVFAAGAGQIGDYDSCCWQSLGQGQFRPLEGSSPYLGQHGEVERVEELRVEMICLEQHMAPALQALRDAHPYEEPAFDILPLTDPSRFERA